MSKSYRISVICLSFIGYSITFSHHQIKNGTIHRGDLKAEEDRSRMDKEHIYSSLMLSNETKSVQTSHTCHPVRPQWHLRQLVALGGQVGAIV